MRRRPKEGGQSLGSLWIRAIYRVPAYRPHGFLLVLDARQAGRPPARRLGAHARKTLRVLLLSLCAALPRAAERLVAARREGHGRGG